MSLTLAQFASDSLGAYADAALLSVNPNPVLRSPLAAVSSIRFHLHIHVAMMGLSATAFVTTITMPKQRSYVL